MGTTLLRMIPIHLKSPKWLQAPGYGYCDRLFVNILANCNSSPLPLSFAFYSENLSVFRSTFRIAFPDEVSISPSGIPLSGFALGNQHFRVLALHVVQSGG